MEALRVKIKAIENLMDRIAYVRQQFEAWQQPQKSPSVHFALELHGVARPTYVPFNFNPFDTEDRDSEDRIQHPRPELESATRAARQLIIDSLKTELTRLEAELSTYTITKK